MLPPTSIFRKTPVALELKLRKLMGGFAYACDATELSYARLKATAENYRFPQAGCAPDQSDWTPSNRLGVIVDAWSFVDNLNRMRRLVGRFPFGHPRPVEVDEFLTATNAVHGVRNRQQHLDEDIAKGRHSSEGHPVFGTVSWIDGRGEHGYVRFFVSSGPTIEAGNMMSCEIVEAFGKDEVGQFSLMLADRQLALDPLMIVARKFASALEETASRSLKSQLKEEADRRGLDLGEVGRNWPCDVVTAFHFVPSGDGWAIKDVQGLTEVAPGFVNLEDKPAA